MDKEILPINPQYLTHICVDEYTLTLNFDQGGILQISGQVEISFNAHSRSEKIAFGARSFKFSCGALIGKQAQQFSRSEDSLTVLFDDSDILIITNPMKIPEAAYLHFNNYKERFVG